MRVVPDRIHRLSLVTHVESARGLSPPRSEPPDAGAHPGAGSGQQRSEPGGPRPIEAARLELERFRVNVQPARDTVRVMPVGELDISTAHQLRERFDELLDARVKSMTLDLRGLSFIDSVGLQSIVELDDRARAGALALTIIQGPRAVRRMFEVTGLLDRLSFRTTGITVSAPTDPLARDAGPCPPRRLR